MFGIFRRVEDRKTNGLKVGGVIEYHTYNVMVTRLVLFWVTVWTWEAEWK